MFLREKLVERIVQENPILETIRSINSNPKRILVLPEQKARDVVRTAVCEVLYISSICKDPKVARVLIGEAAVDEQLKTVQSDSLQRLFFDEGLDAFKRDLKKNFSYLSILDEVGHSAFSPNYLALNLLLPEVTGQACLFHLMRKANFAPKRLSVAELRRENGVTKDFLEQFGVGDWAYSVGRESEESNIASMLLIMPHVIADPCVYRDFLLGTKEKLIPELDDSLPCRNHPISYPADPEILEKLRQAESDNFYTDVVYTDGDNYKENEEADRNYSIPGRETYLKRFAGGYWRRLEWDSIMPIHYLKPNSRAFLSRN